jgi:uncharacterized protein (DUF2235 family)
MTNDSNVPQLTPKPVSLKRLVLCLDGTWNTADSE